jgi:MerR family mercuric resistance operon transcriptional regulator
MTDEVERLTIGAASKRSGVGVETIRYYERIGVLGAPPRTAGGQRTYDPDAVRRLRLIRRARDLGFSLSDVRELLDMAAGERTCAEVRALTLGHLGKVRRKIAELRAMERRLASTTAMCESLDEAECPVLDALLLD